MKESIKQELKSKVKGKISFEESLKNHTSFQVGGPAEVLIIPQDIDDLQQLMVYLNRTGVEHTVIGNGTNLLVSDQGISGVVIKLVGGIDGVEIQKQRITAGGGASLPVVAKQAAKVGLSGLEFASGLPATVGGATVMNAGLKSLNHISKVIDKVRVVSSTGELQIFDSSECEFGYRQSRFQLADSVIVGVEMILKPKPKEKIQSKMEELIAKRKKSQPLKMPNAGCIFKNPSSASAGRLIDEAGGKGMQIGGAVVSSKHANFIVNKDNATAQDIMDLIDEVKTLVKEEYGLELVCEVQIIS
ncbi:UDP-N-acetylmuramate dehydrogenase [Acetohalobium arabaticum]|uniref:UDP-N-acetylenolpyruvoylglucosamine reductase n=1 Tax=Acetohalobium arabaticum (strain ATCC 49924 / DSM 5501 / Z-7288) TaxID=574087 RepID=D9QVM9_ACEAZ|nr:UDP-N-acetylmuramate dehydrogenase [Acetohalobium arabaticum]ADL12288.1 UDP-N-acetylenolpyruvoylglucosamine reductase [Acetohalobium arabaticum DSM 5501]